MQQRSTTPPSGNNTPDANRPCISHQQLAGQPTRPCQGSMAQAGKSDERPQPAPVVRRSTFLRALGASAGLFAAGGAVGSVARAAARHSIAALPAGAPAAVRVAGTGRFLGNAKTLALRQALTYADPATGDPALLIHLANGQFVAYDALCPHAGCTVEFDSKRQVLVCPCHGATFDPAQGARVLGGPTNLPLDPLAIRVDAGQNVFALDAKANGSQASQLKQAPPYTGQTGDDGGGVGDDGGGVVHAGRTRLGTSRATLSPGGPKLSLGSPTPHVPSRRTTKRQLLRRAPGVVRRVTDD